MRLYGRRPVLERIRVAPKTIRTLLLKQGVDQPDIVRAARAAQIRFVSVPKPQFEKLASDLNAQGVLAEVTDFPYTPLEDLLGKPDPRPCLFLLDRITDPQNLGSILRTAACFGGIALVLPKHESADVNETVLRVACGGENYVPVARVVNLARACELAKQAGYWVAGCSADGKEPLPAADWPVPLAVILGSEGGGIRPGLKKHLELTLKIPMPGAALSFNVATAASILAYEIICRREKKTA